MAGMHRAVLALAQAGNHVIAEHVLMDPEWVRDCAHLFQREKAWLMGVRCPLHVVEQREKERRDRTLGQARALFHKVHAHGLYDLEVDTAQHSAAVCAGQIVRHMASGAAPPALRSLAEQGYG